MADYIVVGSGAGGGPVAARVAELGHTVLLLEAGGDEEPWNYQVPVFHGLATEDKSMRLDHYVRHYGDVERQKRDPKHELRDGEPVVFYPRARTLGGCTAHYAMIIIRPHDSDWQAIRDATGDPSWAPAAMNQYFARVPKARRPVPRDIPKEPPQTQERRAVIEEAWPLPAVVVAYHITYDGHPDAYPLHIAAKIMSDGQSARIPRELVYNKRLALTAFGSGNIIEDPNLFYAVAIVQPGQTPEAAERALIT